MKRTKKSKSSKAVRENQATYFPISPIVPSTISSKQVEKKGKVGRGYIFSCTNKSEHECLERRLFSTNKMYGEDVLFLKTGDNLFLYNLDTDTLHGVFKAGSDGKKNIIPDAFDGRYPYQIQVEKNGNLKSIQNTRTILKQMGFQRNALLNPYQVEILTKYIVNPENFDWQEVLKNKKLLVSDDEKPRLGSTTLWDYPKQSYGKTPKGNNKYAGVTPAFIIYNMIKRYTEPGDLVLDPMAGSGTTLDVCKEEGRRCAAYDVVSTRPEIIQNDARQIPLPDNSVDMVFIDSPYGDNVKYNDHRQNIGNISAESEEFYSELEKVMAECYRVMKPGKVLGWLIGDQWVKKKFTPVGFKIYDRLCKYLEPVDVICVVRRRQTSNTGVWHNRAIRFNFYLRGFKYLHLFRKPHDVSKSRINDGDERKVSWTQYERKK